ncbi:hypothetical protein A3A93_05875 [Candidatus Roizmanbacteria bacterium RIFCSPLOWO2_01_FULL_38_12]|uniref:Glycosyl transferase family 1 domain-containing protein n=2 Tax=Microgenomates group TaxID=1794810 RepID=A0A1F7IVB2_9BACT|nr:MAG: hypothetical protein A3F59_00015 [Candidatus Roizmanbacteria bacterium RIFCSPHIGHO2_12_FULL_38_13]OGK47287.1 MAG: hypothetical protein A3A93_05875 [Candidatus Roizmanbacteria bacterium RIFCSPLOWO2_01_FULL_38_12]
MKKIAIFGIRGYQIIYSGYEIFTEKLVNLSNKTDFFYILYTRSKYQKKTNNSANNFQISIMPTVRGKYLETPFYAFFTTLNSLVKPINIILYLGTANTLFIFLQKLLNRKTIVNTAGIDWGKKRWSLFGRWYLFFCEKLTVWFADIIVCDSQSVLNYYKKKYHLKNLIFIPYGTDVKSRKSGKTLKKLKLESNKYIYVVGRFSPENCQEDVINAFKKIKTNFKCVIIGDSFYEDKYKSYLYKLAKNDKRIVFTGILNRNQYEEIASNSYAYVETKSIGGTHPSLLEAMAFGKPVIAKDIEENKEVVDKNGYLYSRAKPSSLTNQLEYLLINVNNAQKKALDGKKRVKTLYNWQLVIRNYEYIFNS